MPTTDIMATRYPRSEGSMPGHRKFNDVRDEVAAERTLGEALAYLRYSQKKNQIDVADAMGSTQSNISRVEHQDDLLVSTVQDYVEALGGRLELAAVLGGKRRPIPLRARE